MNIIYKPKPKALEYAPLAANLYTKCNNGCKYCFNQILGFWNRVKASEPLPRDNILQHLEKQLKRDCTINDEILLCFYCDPYPNIENDITRDVLLLLEIYKKKVIILTKNGIKASRDFDILARNKWKFGVSISVSEETRREKEPFAESIDERIQALKIANKLGIYTWISVEPVIKPLEALVVISLLKDLVDEIKIGKLNHFPDYEKKVDWKSFLFAAESLLIGKKYLIKSSLLQAAGRKVK